MDLIQILKKPGRQRKQNENDIAISLLKSIEFFTHHNIPDKNYMDLLQNIELLEIPKQGLVFDFDTDGDLFYIILAGEVAIYIPDKESAELHRKRSVFEQTQVLSVFGNKMNFKQVATLGAGKSFGELALISGGTRKARIE